MNFANTLMALVRMDIPGAKELDEFLEKMSYSRGYGVFGYDKVIEDLQKHEDREMNRETVLFSTRLEILLHYRETGRLPRVRVRRNPPRETKGSTFGTKVQDVKKVLGLQTIGDFCPLLWSSSYF